MDSDNAAWEWLGSTVRLSRSVFGSARWLVATARNGLEVVRFGGLSDDAEPSPYEVADRKPMYRLRHYFPNTPATSGPVALLIPPPMVNADVYDVNTQGSAVEVMHGGGIDCWVLDFGSPAIEEGGWQRDLADHVLAVSEAIDTLLAHTGRPVHLMGYSQGGMFAYQSAAYRHGRDVASIVTLGSPVDIVAGLPLGLPYALVSQFSDFIADHVLTRLPITDSIVRVGFQLLDPIKTVRARLDFLLQLHDREALLPKERTRRFLTREGWIGYPGPAASDLLRDFVTHNRMLLGGFVIGDQPVTLAELSCPILAFVGDLDDIGQPAAVRGIARAAPDAEVYQAVLHTGHFGMVAGSMSANATWPLVRDWISWREGSGSQPGQITRLAGDVEETTPESAVTRVLRTGVNLAGAGTGVGRALWDVADSAIELTNEAARALPRLARLGTIQPHTRISLGQLLAEQAQQAPQRQCLLFDDRAYTHTEVNTRIDNVVRGLIAAGVRPGTRVALVMRTRPSALAAVAALSRLGAVAVLPSPGDDLVRALDSTGVRMVVSDPENVRTALASGARVLVLGGGPQRELDCPDGADVLDLERIDPTEVPLPGWYRPNPGRARELAYVLVGEAGGTPAVRYVTNRRWALSAFGTATAAALDRGDTVYCLAPLYHSSGLLVSLGGAVASGSRIALARSVDPQRFAEEVRRYGVTVVTYTWTVMRDILDADPYPAGRAHPIRLFIGSGMPAGLWRRTTARFAPAHVLECYASVAGDVVLVNVSGSKIGCKGRPVPGTAPVELVAYDTSTGEIRTNTRGFAHRVGVDEVGLLLGKASEPGDASPDVLRGVFAPGDSWLPAETLFRRDRDGDYWLMDRRDTVVVTARGPVFTEPVREALGDIDAVDLAVVFGLPVGSGVRAAAAVSVRPGFRLAPGDVTDALAGLVADQRPDLVFVVADIPRSASFRPLAAAVREQVRLSADEHTWFYQRESQQYDTLTEEVLAQLQPAS